MSCGKGYSTGSCVCDVLKEIASVQDDIVDDCCDSSCDQSISDLLGATDNRSGLDTVPVMLYCSGTCAPFKGYGANYDNIATKLSSYYFRVKKVTNDCCAVLELLVNENELGTDFDQPGPHSQNTANLRASGICITVDVNCFCHVTCLPAVDAR